MGLWGDGQLNAGEKKPIWLTPAQQKNCFATERGWELLDPSRGQAASVTITNTGQPLNTETITIEDRVYTFEDTLTNVDSGDDGHVHIGASAAETYANLVACINKRIVASPTASEAVDVGWATANTSINSTVSAELTSNTVVTITSRLKGVSGNEINIIPSATFTAATFSSRKLSGGANGSEVLVSIGGLASRLGPAVAGTFLPAAVDATGEDITLPKHMLSVDDRIEFVIDPTDVAPANILEETTYWVESVSGETTLTFAADLVTGNVVNMKVDGVAISPITFTSTNDNTLSLLDTELTGQASISSVTVTGTPTNELLIVAVSNLANPVITDVVVSGGASQTTATIANVDKFTFSATQGGAAFDIGDGGTDNSGNGFQVVHAGLGAAQISDIILLDSMAWTLTSSADFIASDSISLRLNGVTITQTFSVDNDTTIAALAVKIAAEPNVRSATVTDAGTSDAEIVILPQNRESLVDITDYVVTNGGNPSATTATFARQTLTRHNEGQPMTIRVGFSENVFFTNGTTATTLVVSLAGNDPVQTLTASCVGPMSVATSYLDFETTDIAVKGSKSSTELPIIDADTAAANTETVTIAGIVYTFVTTLSTGPAVDGEILVGADGKETRERLTAAVNNTLADRNVNFGATAATTHSPSPLFTAVDDGSTKITFTAIKEGTALNAGAATSEIITDPSIVFPDANFGGGTGASVAGVNGDNAVAGEISLTTGVTLGSSATIKETDTTPVRNLGVYTGAAFATDDLTFATAHGLSVDDNIRLTGLDQPSGLDELVNYFVKVVTSPTLVQLSATKGGSLITLADAGSGTLTAVTGGGGMPTTRNAVILMSKAGADEKTDIRTAFATATTPNSGAGQSVNE